MLPGVSIIIPEGAITDGVQQEIYFKVCQDNSILPPLDKEKGMILIFLHHTHDTNKVRINILFAPSSFQRTINDDEKQLYMLNTVSLLVPPPPPPPPPTYAVTIDYHSSSGSLYDNIAFRKCQQHI